MKTDLLRTLAALCAGLCTAANAWAFTFITDSRTEGALPIKWPPGSVAIQLKLGSSTFNDAAQAAAQNWNAVLGNLVISSQVGTGTTAAQSNGLNELVFAANVFGTAFDTNVLAITTVWSRGNERTQADIDRKSVV